MAQPITQVLLKIEKALQDELITDSGLKLYLDPTYNKNFTATVVATIAALPINPRPKDKKILANLRVGDEVCISYQIITDFEFKGDGGQFMSMIEDNPYVKEFINGRGETIKMYALPPRAGIKEAVWVGLYQNKFKELVDGTQGDESDVFRWAAQFPFGKTDIYTFNNFFEYDKQDYWKCDVFKIFAKRVKGHLIAVNDRVICKPIDEPIDDPHFIKGTEGNQRLMLRRQDRARVVTGGKDKGLKKDEIISFHPQFVEKYEFFGKPYYLIKEQYVLGKWN